MQIFGGYQKAPPDAQAIQGTNAELLCQRLIAYYPSWNLALSWGRHAVTETRRSKVIIIRLISEMQIDVPFLSL